MVVLVGKDSPFFDREKAKYYFEINKENLDDRDGFDALVDAGVFYNIYDKGYTGSIFCYQSEDGYYYLGGYSLRGHHKGNIEAIKRVSSMYDEVLAKTRHKTAVIALLRAGFKWHNRDKRLLRRMKNG